jgi:hypothetical protein
LAAAAAGLVLGPALQAGLAAALRAAALRAAELRVKVMRAASVLIIMPAVVVVVPAR